MAQPTVNTGDIFSIIYRGILFGQETLLTLHYSVALSGGSVDEPLFDFSDLIQAQIDALGGLSAAYQQSCSRDLVDMNVYIQKIWPTRYIRKIYTPGAGHGEVLEDSMPPNCSHVITLRGDAAGPTKRGNKHITAVPPSYTAEGVMTGAGAASYTTLAAAMKATISPAVIVGAADLTPIVYHRANPGVSVPITNHILGQTTRTERRRTVGLGS